LERNTGKIWFESGHWRGAADIPDVDAFPTDQRRVIGLAGAAGLMVWLGIPADRFFDMNVGVSTSDWKLVGVVPVAVTRQALVAAMEMLDREILRALSRRMIVESRQPAIAGEC
jgi:hypothetical protein